MFFLDMILVSRKAEFCWRILDNFGHACDGGPWPAGRGEATYISGYSLHTGAPKKYHYIMEKPAGAPAKQLDICNFRSAT